MDPPWTLLVLPMLLLAALHFRLNESELKWLPAQLGQWRGNAKSESSHKRARFEKELLKARINIFEKVHSFCLHVSFFAIVAALLGLMADPSFAALTQLASPLSGYALHACVQTGILEVKTELHFRFIKFLGVSIFVLYLSTAANQTDIEVLCAMEKVTGALQTFMSFVFIDFTMTLPVYMVSAVVLTYKHWQLLGFSRVTSELVSSTIISSCASLGMGIFTVYAMKRHIAARLDSDDTSSLLLAFRRVLRGVCDGELVLDRRNHRIVEDASSLERLLNAKKKLSETSFLDLFLDSEGRQRFLEFLDSESSTKENRATIPSCLRIALQGASGPVSTDVFFTSCGAAGQEYYLLAFRADPEQFIAPPDAVADGHKAPWQNDQMNHLSPPPASSVEVAEAFKELVQVGMAEKGKRLLFSIVFNCSWKFNGRTEVSPCILNACSMLLCLSKSLLRPCSSNHQWHFDKATVKS